MGRKIEKILYTCFGILALAMYSFLVYVSIKSSWYNYNFKDEFVVYSKDNIFINIFSLAVAFVLLYLIKKTVNKYKKININIILIIILLMVSFIGWYWVTYSGAYPNSDQIEVAYAAIALKNKDLHYFVKGGYMALNPHQLGLMTYDYLIFSVFGFDNFIALQYANIPWALLIVFFGFKIVKLESNDDKYSEIVFLILLLTCLPFFGYIPFCYGEIPSVACILASVYYYLKIYSSSEKKNYLLLLLFTFLAILFRKNSLIVYIGVLIVALIHIICNHLYKKCLVIFVVIAGLILPGIFTKAAYGHYYPDDAKAIPNILYIRMGLNDNDENHYGWFNGYNYTHYEYYDYNPDLASEASIYELNQIKNQCLENKMLLPKIIINKIVTQWNAPMYHCIAMNNYIRKTQSNLASSIYYGNGNNITNKIANIHQLVVYELVLLSIIKNLLKRNNINDYVLLIGIFGGFLFSIIWEAKTRYIFPYYILSVAFICAPITKAKND